MTIVVNVELRHQLKVDKRITDLCLFAVVVCIVVVGSLLVIVELLHSVGGLLRGVYFACGLCPCNPTDPEIEVLKLRYIFFTMEKHL